MQLLNTQSIIFCYFLIKSKICGMQFYDIFSKDEKKIRKKVLIWFYSINNRI